MPIFLGILTLIGGLFLFLWYRTVVSFPVKRQPLFIHSLAFKWGIPLISAATFTSGLYQIAAADRWLAGIVLGSALLLSFLIMKFDRYSAEMRVIYGRYRTLREANPDMQEIEVLFHTARWRYPSWPHDRIVELVAGKDIVSLMLLMLINENKINPISDWELYRSLKTKATRIAGVAKGGLT